MKSISAIELKEKLEHQEDLMLIDVREPFEYDICHLPGALLLPLHSLPAHAKDIDTTKPVVVYCHHGIRSAHAIHYLQSITGASNFFNLEGGIDAWSVQVDATVPRY